MQPYEMECNFVKKYIVRNRQERLLFELDSQKRRRECIWRFGHCALELLKQNCVREVAFTKGALYLTEGELLDYTGNTDVLVVHPDACYDRSVIPLSEALDQLLGSGPYILIDCTGKFAFVETEPDVVNHEYILLKENA